MNSKWKHLVEIVAAQMELDPSESDFAETLADVRAGGAQAGFPGFTYTSDMKQMFRDHGGTLRKRLMDIAEEYGENTETFVRSFPCLKKYDPGVAWERAISRVFLARDDGYDAVIADAIAWCFLEHVAASWEWIGHEFIGEAEVES